MKTLEKKKLRAKYILGAIIAFVVAGVALTIALYDAIANATTSSTTGFEIAFLVQLIVIVGSIFVVVALGRATFQWIFGNHQSIFSNLGKEFEKLTRRRGNQLWIYCAFALAIVTASAPEPRGFIDATTVSDYYNVIMNGAPATVNTSFLPDAPLPPKTAAVVLAIDWVRLRFWLWMLLLLAFVFEFGEDAIHGISNVCKNWEKWEKKILDRIDEKKAQAQPIVASAPSPMPPEKPMQPPTAEKQPAEKTAVPAGAAALASVPTPPATPKDLWEHIARGEVTATVITAIAFGLFHAFFHEFMEQRNLRKGLVTPV